MPKNTFGPNLVLNRVASTSFDISGVAAAPPTDGSADTTINGSLALTPIAAFQRVGGGWVALASTANNAGGRFVTGSAVILNGDSRVLVPIAGLAGVANGDRVFITANSDTTNANVAVVMYGAEIVGDNVNLIALASNGAVQTVTNNTTLFYMIDTST